jgi:CheY-like chemotaxis protein
MSDVRRFSGTGLGLSISQRLVSLLGGAPISVESEPNAGSRFAFHLTLPVADQAYGPKAADDMARPPVLVGRLAGYRLLLVDDDEDIRFVVRRLLETEGATVDEAEDGTLGVSTALAATTPHNAVLMDMRMPGMHGVDAARALRAKGYTRPIIAMTANALARDKDTCLAAGMDDFISKPVKIGDLVGALQRNHRD